jgi:2-polyprenyl-3-methyl-5-hydroxy-6-metoxy-1,4-benzoquinol methylase
MVYNGYTLRTCGQCNFVFTAQRSFATSQYEDIYSGVIAYQRMIQEAQQTHLGDKGLRDLWWFKRKALRWLRGSLPKARLLDVGSGPGTLLMVARRVYGYEVQGVEPAKIAADAANGYEVPTYCGTVQDYAKTHSEKFDAITSFEVLEHVAEPLDFLQTIRTLLKKDGLLILSTPNLDDPYCLRQRIPPAMPPIHINFFSRRSLKPLLERAGLTTVRTFTLPIPTSTVRNVCGKSGFLARLPYLFARRLVGRADGTTLLTMARPTKQ